MTAFSFPGLLQLGQLPMRRVRLRVQRQHLILVKPVELLRLPYKKSMADDRLRRILILHMIEPVLAPEVRNPALRRDARPSEEDDIVAPVDDLLQLPDLIRIHCCLLSPSRSIHSFIPPFPKILPCFAATAPACTLISGRNIHLYQDSLEDPARCVVSRAGRQGHDPVLCRDRHIPAVDLARRDGLLDKLLKVRLREPDDIRIPDLADHGLEKIRY